MIAHLRGRLIAKDSNRAIVDCGGVGYDVTITVPTFTELPEASAEVAAAPEVALHIYTNVREDQIALFGFLRPEEKRLFEKLIDVSGIGPGLAVKILSGQTAVQLVSAIRAGEVARLTKIPGIGKKTAERMVLELRDKLEEFATAATAVSERRPAQKHSVEEDVLSALVNLGYQQMAAERALALLAPYEGKGFDTLFRDALAALSK
jgi:Holliday junction DNA helicase RuvA